MPSLASLNATLQVQSCARILSANHNGVMFLDHVIALVVLLAESVPESGAMIHSSARGIARQGVCAEQNRLWYSYLYQ